MLYSRGKINESKPRPHEMCVHTPTLLTSLHKPRERDRIYSTVPEMCLCTRTHTHTHISTVKPQSSNAILYSYTLLKYLHKWKIRGVRDHTQQSTCSCTRAHTHAQLVQLPPSSILIKVRMTLVRLAKQHGNKTCKSYLSEMS